MLEKQNLTITLNKSILVFLKQAHALNSRVKLTIQFVELLNR